MEAQKRGMGLPDRFLPTKLAPPKSRFVLGIGNAFPAFGTGEGAESGKLLAPALRHQAAQLGIVIGEELEGRRTPPLFAHEKQRRFRSQKKQGRYRPESGRLDLVIEALAHGPIAHLIVVLEADHEFVEIQSG